MKNKTVCAVALLLTLLLCMILAITAKAPDKQEKNVTVALKDQLVQAATREEVEQQQQDIITNIGEFKLTAYCPCEKCCGKSDGITATGAKAEAGKTVAVDTKLIPYGTQLIIGENEYIASDRGGAIKGNIIDIYFDSHEEALEFGVQYDTVFVVKPLK